MGIREVIERARDKSKEKKEILKRMLDQDQMETIVEQRKKSSNERELEGYMKEEYEKKIKTHLDHARKARDNDIRFGHNPLNVKNITAGTDWEVMKEKNMFKGRTNMFQGQENIHKSNHNLMNSGSVLKGKNLFKHKGSGLI